MTVTVDCTKFVFLFCVAATIAGILLVTKPTTPLKFMSEKSKVLLVRISSKPQKKFAYLTQTESCLSDYLRSPQNLGNSTSCQCDILVLSWKQKCNDSFLPHVEYIFDPNTTWTTGRNLLYKSIMKREQKYLYYTFLDDDITLGFKEEPQENASAWREYEKSLLQERPPIAVSWLSVTVHFRKFYEGACNYTNKPDFLPFIWFDAMFNSFHSEVINYLLPYYDKKENISWWYSQVYLIMKTDLMFPGQVFHHLNVLASNNLHRPYARKMFDSNTVREFLDDLKNEIPAKYLEQLQPKLEDWVKNVNQKEQEKYHCPLYPVVMEPIVPYGYIDTVGN